MEEGEGEWGAFNEAILNQRLICCILMKTNLLLLHCHTSFLYIIHYIGGLL
jgi:hypothetical protein